ncbi:MAG: YifB family Mg chelatase-like AAA ATPase [Acidaminobacteraceae bacterium]
MYSEISSAVLDGLYGKSIKVETYIGNGIPGIKIIGLANTTVTEAKERIRAASKISNIKLPNRKIIVNLSPANIKKEGSHLDLPILCGIYMAGREDGNKLPPNVGFLGEIGLNGEIKTSKGILSMILEQKNSNIDKVVVANSEIIHLKVTNNITMVPVSHISEVVELIDSGFSDEYVKKLREKYIFGEIHNQDVDQNRTNHGKKKNAYANASYEEDYIDVNGQDDVKRIMQIAAAGGHNVIILGEPGIGKTMCASRINSIMPDLSDKELLECMLIKSSTGNDDINDFSRPIRSPYKNITESAMFGGGQKGRIGEVTMAHNGVLILDEMLEFNRKIIDGFRQPLEENCIRISRVGGNYEYPCNFILIGTANPCPCGYYAGSKRCSCSDLELKKYMKKLSGPVIDRVDITYLMSREASTSGKVSSKELKLGVESARKMQLERYNDVDVLNSSLKAKSLEDSFGILSDALEILKRYTRQFNISSRGYNKILRLSRTIADLENHKEITISDISEALNYRFFDEILNSYYK